MIVQIRGTSGSGKTWVMREVIRQLGEQKSFYVEGRKQPLYYLFGQIAVLGHYEATCGGCDNIGSAAKVYELVKQVQPTVRHILCEGLLLSEDTKWSSQLQNLRVVYLITDVEQCIKQIKQRRVDAGNDKELNENNTRKRVAVIERSRIKLENLGVVCRRCSASQAVGVILKWLQE